MHDEIWQLDATAQAALVRKGELSAVELVEAALARIERLDPGRDGTDGIGAIGALDAEAARARASAATGLVVLGKTATSELGLLGSTETLLEGQTRNPWSAGLSAGGSSGDSAAAVAARMVPMAHASDGGGSIRIPAAMNGVFGFKPGRGRMLLSGTQDMEGLRHARARPARRWVAR